MTIRLGMLVVVATLVQPLPAAARGTTAEGKVHQLRIYEIFEHNKAAFHQRFRQHAVRIMERHGFLILSMWESKSDGRTEFVYLLEWPSERAMKDSWARFMADQEWSDIKARTRSEHGVLVGQIQERVLHATEYSPRRSTPR
jgi:heme-degrading monooxygenase HmoA